MPNCWEPNINWSQWNFVGNPTCRHSLLRLEASCACSPVIIASVLDGKTAVVNVTIR